jgi:N-acetylmuramoyl-L-alanine amidase
MKVTNHVLDSDRIDRTYIDCPKRGGPLQKPDTIIIHYTGGVSARSATQWLCEGPVQASAHIVIDRESGTIYQLVPFDTEAWHAGRSSYTFPDGTKRSGFNSCSIGIELDNAGPLTKTGSGYQSWSGHTYPVEQTVLATHRNGSEERYWHTFSEIQMQVLEEVCLLLKTEYGITHILGHDEIAPTRKTDPGPAFPMDSFRHHILYSDRNQDEGDEPDELLGRVTSHRLNIRSGPSGEERTIADPLAKNDEVTILEKKSGWLRVRSEIEGWVWGKYIEERSPERPG